MVIITRIAAVTLLFTVSAALAGPANPKGKPEETSEYENKQPPLAPGIKFPNRFLTSWWFTVTRGGKPYINCNHTTKTCDRGAIDSRSECFVGAEVPDEDRNHVLRNIGWCSTRAGLFTDYVVCHRQRLSAQRRRQACASYESGLRAYVFRVGTRSESSFAASRDA